MTLGHEEAVALAGGLTGVLAVPLAVATFFAERVASTVRSKKALRAALLGGLFVSGLYLLVCAAVAWWAWDQAIASGTALIWGMSSETVFAALFVPPSLFAAVCVAGGGVGLGKAAWAEVSKEPA
ncbi:MAG TPA: hypothetical protein VED41_07715 [Solirubrobacteraceae bacterium]|nr:hypothetical protein [Solirubrobacteraceae bacterium]